jgi:hypothetical protein
MKKNLKIEKVNILLEILQIYKLQKKIIIKNKLKWK